jgi:predicted RNA-binding protein YlqC (UPF0109 family)
MIARAWAPKSRLGFAPLALSYGGPASRRDDSKGDLAGGRVARADLVEADVEALMKSLIMAIVQALVDKPAEVQIKEVIGEHAHVLELRVAKEDLGKVIGKGGAHASAIRTLMAAASGKEKKRYILEIIEY